MSNHLLIDDNRLSQPITHSSQRLYPCRLAAKFSAQGAYNGIYYIAASLISGTPDMLQQLTPGHGLTLVFDQVAHDTELQGRQRNAAFRQHQLPGFDI